jgi:hypothetical protein
MFRRALAGVVLVGLLVWLMGGPFASGFAWGVTAYLLWRAAPGVLRDVRGVRSRVPAGVTLPRLRRGRGERL